MSWQNLGSSMLVILLATYIGWEALEIRQLERQLAAIACPTPVHNLDKECTAWLFKTNLRAAKQKICGK